MSDNSNFFDHQTESSKIKAKIVSEYFPQYCKIIARKHMPKKFGYIDLFAGPGIYENGRMSTPVLIGKKVYNDEILRNKVWMVFNDKEYGETTLKENFESVFPPETFGIDPFFANREFGNCPNLDRFITRNTMEGFYNECPSVMFIDQFGYKFIYTELFAKFLTQWGNELFIFVNTKRLTAAFYNDKFQEIIRQIFPVSYQEVKKELMKLNSVQKKHWFIISHIGEEIQKLISGYVYFTAFEFREEDLNTPSHFLLHLTKGPKGYELVKTIYSQYANVPRVLNGIATYTFDKKYVAGNDMMDEFFRQENIQTLKNQLLDTFKGKTIAADELFREHQKGTRHATRHYRLALRQLYDEGKIETKYIDNRNHQVSVLLIPECIITFK